MIDNNLNSVSEWFVAKLTAVCPADPADSCSSYTCSWSQYVMCENMQKLTTTDMQLVSGDCVKKYNVAVPIDELEPTVGSIVLMRQRGTYLQENNIYEFVNIGSGSNNFGESCCHVQDVNCSTGFLQVTYSDTCT